MTYDAQSGDWRAFRWFLECVCGIRSLSPVCPYQLPRSPKLSITRERRCAPFSQLT
jgi:hypothetical protein